MIRAKLLTKKVIGLKRTKVFSFRLPEDHPFWQEKEKTEVLRQALDIYYAVKLFTSGENKTSRTVETYKSKADTTVDKQKKTINIREFIQNPGSENIRTGELEVKKPESPETDKSRVTKQKLMGFLAEIKRNQSPTM
ncbi:hypothetical protein Calla_1646 [Caldicellulosiruptor acetigenus 6A]|uniref:Uncharacterized protein n=1 Tax=Caldicellulosiruptor acetigenus 6A TaxID=632516 RepID=G2PT86_9FIRM|nr:hypothetical protein Calla_1646 [Caldicellulosiruptor acetigenus 6A]